LFLLVLFKKTAIELINKGLSIAPKKLREPLAKIAHTFIEGLKTLQNGKESFLVLMMSLGTWTCEFTSYYFLAIGMGIGPSPITLWAAALIMTLVNLAILLPSTPGGIGIFESVGVAIAAYFGIDKPTGVAFMILVHLLVFIPVTLLGAYFYSQEHLNFNKLAISAKTAPKTKKAKARK
jgi:uncharacterized protein (TIRG00374 family)